MSQRKEEPWCALTVDVRSVGSAQQESYFECIDDPSGWCQKARCVHVAILERCGDAVGWPVVTFSDLSDQVAVVIAQLKGFKQVKSFAGVGNLP